VLEVDTELQPLELGNLDDTRIGSPVVAIGYALNLGGAPSVTTGVVSAKEREIQEASPILGALQTDAAINPGNSGGPLLNLRGEVVGVNTAINPGAQGIGFAVGVETVKAVVPELIESGLVTRGLIGVVGFEDVSPAMAEQLGFPLGAGVRILQVTPGSPAAAAGIEAGDIFTEVNNREVDAASDLPLAMIGTAAGEEIEITYYRDGQEQTASVVLDPFPDTV
jgi:serine protease Do